MQRVAYTSSWKYESKRHHENHYVKDVVGNSTHLERLLAHTQLSSMQ